MHHTVAILKGQLIRLCLQGNRISTSGKDELYNLLKRQIRMVRVNLSPVSFGNHNGYVDGWQTGGGVLSGTMCISPRVGIDMGRPNNESVAAE